MAVPWNKKKPQQAAAVVPSSSLGSVLELVEVAHNYHQAGGSTPLDELATRLGYPNENSGAFRNRTASAKKYRAASSGGGRIVITPLGMSFLDPAKRGQALVTAWMNIPEFKALFDRYKGRRLPGPAEMERDFFNLGVGETRLADARRIFLSSAQTASLLNAQTRRLEIPAAIAADTFSPEPKFTPPPLPAPNTAPSYSQVIHLPDGVGSITLTTDINPFALQGEVRDTFFQIVDLFKQFGDSAKGQRRP